MIHIYTAPSHPMESRSAQQQFGLFMAMKYVNLFSVTLDGSFRTSSSHHFSFALKLKPQKFLIIGMRMAEVKEAMNWQSD